MKLENNIENQNLRDKANTSPKNERGSTMVEYALLVALMSIGCIASIGAASSGVEDAFMQARSALAQATVNPGN